MIEYVTLILGILIGAVVVYLLLSRRITTIVEGKARDMAIFMFNQQRDQLEQEIHKTYSAKLEEWKAIELITAIKEEREDALSRARAVLKGRIGEQMAPMLPEFVDKYNAADARFIGNPVDYMIFKNLSHVAEGSDEAIELILLDVKSGQYASLTKVQRKIKEAIETGRVKWDMLRLFTPNE